jgi:epoxyqueuosine reductase
LSSSLHTNRSLLVKNIAKELGFNFCGISKSDFLEEEAPRLENWLNKNRHGAMTYMENHFDMRLDPRLLVGDAKSVISLLLNYYPTEEIQTLHPYKISKYAYGEDYHAVIKQKLFEFYHRIEEKIGKINGRVFVDSAPVMDKVWAKKAGLGWVGKHSNLINKNIGSFFFIAEIIIDVVLEPDGPIKDYCGTCTRCVEACPTDAIVEPYTVDGSKCISYLTIELKNEIPEKFRGKMEHWVFGCDICQDVCPWNRFKKPTHISQFEPIESFKNLNAKDLENLTEETFSHVFNKSALKRAKLKGLSRNIKFVSEQSL